MLIEIFLCEGIFLYILNVFHLYCAIANVFVLGHDHHFFLQKQHLFALASDRNNSFTASNIYASTLRQILGGGERSEETFNVQLRQILLRFIYYYYH